MAGGPPPPPELDPVADVGAARAAARDARARLEATMGRAAALTEAERHQRVDGEWSTVESLRHLVLVIDLWLSRTIEGDPDPFDPIALPPTFMPPTLFPGSSIDPEARPTFAEASSVLRSRLDALDTYVDALTADELGRPVAAHVHTVGGALSVVFHELTAHDGFVNRDLDALGERGAGRP